MQAARVDEEVSISSGRSGGDFGTKSVKAHKKKKISHADGGKIVDAPSLGIAYLHLFLAERDAIHNVGAGKLVWLRIDLILGL